MDKLDAQLYYDLKICIRKANNSVITDDLGLFKMPIILVDYHNYNAHCFNDEYDVKRHIENNLSDYLSECPEGEDTDLVLIKYCMDEHKDRWGNLYDNYELYKEINGKKVYREITYVNFELETTVNINI